MSASPDPALLPCDLLSAAVRWAFTDGGYMFFDDEAKEYRRVMACPACGIERTDYEGPAAHLPECPNCGSAADPVPQFSGLDLHWPAASDLIAKALRERGFEV